MNTHKRKKFFEVKCGVKVRDMILLPAIISFIVLLLLGSSLIQGVCCGPEVGEWVNYTHNGNITRLEILCNYVRLGDYSLIYPSMKTWEWCFNGWLPPYERYLGNSWAYYNSDGCLCTTITDTWITINIRARMFSFGMLGDRLFVSEEIVSDPNCPIINVDWYRRT